MKLLLFFPRSFSYQTAAKSLTFVPDVEKEESGSKAEPDFSEELRDEVEARLKRVDFEVTVTPFGYFNEFNIHVAGDSLAKVFKDF